MAILIDMDMPTDCRDCPMETYYSSTGETVCIASWEILAYPYQTIQFNGRPDWCPLREVVRCKDCKWHLNGHLCKQLSQFGSIETPEGFYCGFGERREE